MEKRELQKVALYFIDKGYYGSDSLRYSDELYDASNYERDICFDYMQEIIDYGRNAFIEKYEL